MEQSSQQQETPPIRKFSLKTIDQSITNFEVHPDIKISDLKIKIRDVKNVPIESQRLICRGKLMRDDQLLSHFLKEDDQVIHMMVSQPQPAQNAQQQQQQSAPAGPNANFQNPFNFQAGFQMPRQGIQVFNTSLRIPPNLNDQGQMIGNLINNVMSGVFPQSGSGRSRRGHGGIFSGTTRSNQQNQTAPRPQEQQQTQAQPNQPQSQESQQIPQPQPQPQPQQQNRVQVSLPYEDISRMGDVINNFYGPGASFPSPPLPQLPTQRNLCVLLGGFILNYSFQMLRLIPFIERVGTILQREPFLTDPQHRAETQQLVQQVGSALQHFQTATQQILEILQTFQMGQQAGQFNATYQGRNVISEAEIQQEQQGQNQPQQAQNASVDQSQNVPQQPSQSQEQQSSSVQQPQQQQQSSGQNFSQSMQFNIQQNIQQSLNPPNLQGLSQQQLSPEMDQIQQQIQSAIQQAIQQGGQPQRIEQSVNITGAQVSIPHQSPIHLIMNENLNRLTLRELSKKIGEELSIIPGAFSILWGMTIENIHQLFDGNVEVLQETRQQAKLEIKRQLVDDNQSNRQLLVQREADSLMSSFSFPLENIHEGFDPQLVTRDILEKLLINLVNLIIDSPQSNFAMEFHRQLLIGIGEWVNEIAEGMKNGLDGVINGLFVMLNQFIQREVGQEVALILSTDIQGVDSHLLRVIKKFLQQCSQKHRNSLLNNEQERKDHYINSFISKWNKYLQKDQPQPVKTPLSKAYTLGWGQPAKQYQKVNPVEVLKKRLVKAVFRVNPDKATKLKSVTRELAVSYLQAFRKDVTEKIKKDPDFSAKRFPDSQEFYKPN